MAPASITHLSGKGWRRPSFVIVEEIEKGKNVYYVVREGKNFLVTVAPGPERKHLRTRAEGPWSDVLLSLAQPGDAAKPA